MEWNYGRNGHHGHYHAIAFLKPHIEGLGPARPAVNVQELTRNMFDMWSRGVEAAGGKRPSRACFHVSEVSNADALATYCTKMAINAAGALAAEAARADEKVARGSSRSVMQVLADATAALTKARCPDAQIDAVERRRLWRQGIADARIFHEVVAATRNLKWIIAPRAAELRTLFGAVQEDLDVSCSTATEGMIARGWTLVGGMGPELFSLVRAKHGLATMVRAVAAARDAGDASLALLALIDAVGVNGPPYRPVPPTSSVTS